MDALKALQSLKHGVLQSEFAWKRIAIFSETISHDNDVRTYPALANSSPNIIMKMCHLLIKVVHSSHGYTAKCGMHPPMHSSVANRMM